MNKSKAALLFLTIASTGCASIVSDTFYPVAITSTPDQADFVVTNTNGDKVFTGKTPSTVTLRSGAAYFKGEQYSVNLSKDGYKDQLTTVESYINGWYFGNLGFGGLVGMLIVDPLTGAMWRLPDAAPHATLIKK